MRLSDHYDRNFDPSHVAKPSSQVGRIKERSDAAPAMDACGVRFILTMLERPCAWSCLLDSISRFLRHAVEELA